MLKKVLVLLSLLVFAACDPKEAEVESKPFAEPQNDGVFVLDTEPLQLNRVSWFFWKNPDDMATVLKIGGALEVLEKNIMAGMRSHAELSAKKQNYISEILGQDNQVIWEELEAKRTTAQANLTAATTERTAEEAKPESERNQSRIDELSLRIATLQDEVTLLEDQLTGIEQQSGHPEFRQTLNQMNQQIVAVVTQLTTLKQTAQGYQIQLSKLVELVPDAPKLILKDEGGALYIELVDFKKGDITCSTETGLIRDVIYKKSEGYIEFTAICKQPTWATQTQLVSYRILIENIPTSPTTLLSGNMGRCVDNLPNLGKCEGGLATGVMKYRP